MIPTPKDYTQDALDKLLWQYRDSPNIKAILEQPLEELELTQQETFNIINNFNIDDATDYLLDMVGKIVGVNRRGREDPEFRDAIRLRILFNTSNGTPNKILQALAAATNATKVNIWEHYPLACTYYSNGDVQPSNLAEAIQAASPATCNNIVIFIDPDEDTFIPSELDISEYLLVDHNDNEFVTHNDDNIEVANLNSLLNENPDRNLLSEYTYGGGSGTEKDTKDGYGILVEVVS